MKLRDNQATDSRRVAIVNHEIIRAKAIIAESRLHNARAHELTHTARNLRAVSSLMREQIHLWRQKKFN
jgi:hypothetical protein